MEKRTVFSGRQLNSGECIDPISSLCCCTIPDELLILSSEIPGVGYVTIIIFNKFWRDNREILYGIVLNTSVICAR